MAHRPALHQPSQRRSQVGCRLITMFLGQPGVASDVEETDRRWSLEPAVDSGFAITSRRPRSSRGPGPRLLRGYSQDGLLASGVLRAANSALAISSALWPAMSAGSTTWEFHHAPSASAICGCSPRRRGAGARWSSTEAAGDLQLEEGHERHLVFAQQVVRRRSGRPDRLPDARQQLEGDAGASTGRRNVSPASVANRLYAGVSRKSSDRERSAALLPRGRGGSRRPRATSPSGLCARQRAKVTRLSRNDDAEIDQTVDIVRLHPGAHSRVLAWIRRHRPQRIEGLQELGFLVVSGARPAPPA